MNEGLKDAARIQKQLNNEKMTDIESYWRANSEFVELELKLNGGKTKGNTMSERGSFCTQYVYCDKCFNELRKHLVSDHKYLSSTVIPPWGDDNEVPIIAGKIGGLGAGDIDLFFEFELADKLKNKLCCDISISASDDNGKWTVYNYEGKHNE